ncbi:MAG TPA: chlorite dismutase, partial [Acidimicrobiales bacterium]|nr:chlorite dismutase [Acidimicrobiales bacterium]
MEPVVSAEGWGVLHLFARPRPGADGEAVAAAVKACQGDDHQVVPFAVLGHKGTLGFMALGPDLWRLQRL